jgi:hypothetical protein
MQRTWKFWPLFLFVFWGMVSGAPGQAVPGLDAIRVASGLSSPLLSTAPPGDFNRLFIAKWSDPDLELEHRSSERDSVSDDFRPSNRR